MEQYKDDDEILDLVDLDDTVIGTIARSDTTKLCPDSGYIRAAGAFIMNSKGQLWTPIRSLTKKIAPGGYDFGCDEHVSAGESYDEAIIRGFKEELNLKVDLSGLGRLAVLPPNPTTYYFRAIYLYRTDKAPDYNENDFIGYEWLTPEQIRTNIANGTPAKSVLLEPLALLENINKE